MNVNGFIKTSLLDFPGIVATTIFTGGCNFNCPFCHNGDLVKEHQSLPKIMTDDIINHIKKRKGLIDGICISGGEPTLQKDLIDFMKKVKDYDIKIKLDTNGYNPTVLQKIINLGLVDYVAMDIKNSPDKYAKTCGLKILDYSLIDESINTLMLNNLDYEFRTTVIKEFHTKEDILLIADRLKGSQKYCLQQYIYSNKQVCNLEYTRYDSSTLKEWANIIKPLFDKVEIRGV